jgi:hypothetical protein
LVHDGAERHFQGEVCPGGSVAILALAVLSALGAIHGLAVKVVEGSEARIRLHVDAAAAPAVPARRPAMRNEPLAPKRYGTVSTVAGFDPESTLVHEMHGAAYTARAARARQVPIGEATAGSAREGRG